MRKYQTFLFFRRTPRGLRADLDSAGPFTGDRRKMESFLRRHWWRRGTERKVLGTLVLEQWTRRRGRVRELWVADLTVDWRAEPKALELQVAIPLS